LDDRPDSEAGLSCAILRVCALPGDLDADQSRAKYKSATEIAVYENVIVIQ
jgi:hypothetical protein